MSKQFPPRKRKFLAPPRLPEKMPDAVAYAYRVSDDVNISTAEKVSTWIVAADAAIEYAPHSHWYSQCIYNAQQTLFQ